VTVKLKEGDPVPAHKFVLVARSDFWANLKNAELLGN
jgi:hypothetical protein